MQKRLNKILITFLLTSIVFSYGCQLTSSPVSTVTVTSTGTSTGLITASANTFLFSFADIVHKTMQSVVFILQTYTGEKGEVVEVSGSGIILRSDGYILTNRHVVEKAETIQVTLENLNTYTPTNIFLDDTLDLAVLKIDAVNLPVVTFADDDVIQTGDLVIALGHPLGVSPEEGGAAATMGIISSLKRSFIIENTPYYDVIQTDAAINIGNSGGPLINLKGELVGINSATSSEGQGIGFAINVTTARHVFEDMVVYGRPRHAFMGISLQDITFSSGGNKVMGSQVTYVEPSGPAENAGIRVNDIILNFDGQRINFTSDLIRQLWRRDINDQVPVTVFHGTTVQIQMILGERPECGLCQTQSPDSPSARF